MSNDAPNKKFIFAPLLAMLACLPCVFIILIPIVGLAALISGSGILAVFAVVLFCLWYRNRRKGNCDIERGRDG